MALQDFFDPSIEAFDHSIGLWGFRRCQTVLDIQISAKLVERVRVDGLRVELALLVEQMPDPRV